MLNLKTIRSHQDAYDVATMIEEQMKDGETVSINWINITKQDDRFIVTGQEHKGTKYCGCELADFILWPERKRVNDWIRTYAQVQFEEAAFDCILEAQAHREGWL